MTNSPFEIVVDTVTDNEDGSAGITVTMSDQAQASVIELGLQFIFTCAAAKVDIQDALDGILGDKELLWAAENDAKEAEAYAEELEAKLAKAVDVLGYYARNDDGGELASETIKELTGGKDE